MNSFIISLKTVFKSRIIFAMCIMLFFWALFDGLVSYITPVAIKNAGYSNTILGLIMGFSSLAGAFFDFLLSKFLTNTHYRRIFLFMFITCALYPLLLINANSLIFFLLAMAVWGLYYDLYNFGTMDFVSRKFKENSSTLSFFLMNTYTNLGYMVFYFIFAAGITLTINWFTFTLLYLVLGISFLSFLLLLFFNQKENKELLPDNHFKRLSFFIEAKLWLKINKILMPLLILTLLFNIFYGFFWTLGPLMADSMNTLPALSDITSQISVGSINTSFTVNNLNLKPNSFYTLSGSTLIIIAFLFVVSLCILIFFKKIIGKLQCAYAFLYLGSVMMALLTFIHNKFEILVYMMIAFTLFGIALPWLDSVYSDYIKHTSNLEKEIQAIRDFFINLGYIFGPIISGILADNFGYTKSFSYLGWAYLLIVLIMLILASKNPLFKPHT